MRNTYPVDATSLTFKCRTYKFRKFQTKLTGVIYESFIHQTLVMNTLSNLELNRYTYISLEASEKNNTHFTRVMSHKYKENYKQINYGD